VKFGAWLNYPLTKAAMFLSVKWELKAHVLVVGPLFLCLGWRKPAPEGGVWADRDMPTDPDSWPGRSADVYGA
jgi:hypothetical protein